MPQDNQSFATAARISWGDAVPVPFFMTVMEATMLPKLAASTGSWVTAMVSAVPAAKLSPAPQMSTGFSTGRGFGPGFLALFEYQRALGAVRQEERLGAQAFRAGA